MIPLLALTYRNGWKDSVELMLSLQKRSDNGEAVATVLLSSLIFEMHEDLLAIQNRFKAKDGVVEGETSYRVSRRTSSLSFIAGADSVSNGSTKDRRSWLSAIENTFIWDNIQELVRFVSIWAASGRVAVAGMPGAKRAIVLQRRLDETKSKMTSQSLNRCRYECNEKRHSAFCIMSVENCPQCGHSLLAHKMCPPPDLFRDLRRRLDEEIRGGGIDRIESKIASTETLSIDNLTDDDDDDDDDGISASGGGGKDDTILDEEGRTVSLGDQYEDDSLDQLKFDPSYYSHGLGGNTNGGSRVLRMEFGGLDGYDHGGLRRFVTNADIATFESSTYSPQNPMQPLSAMACGAERKLFVLIQLSHLLDLLLFPNEIECRQRAGALSKQENEDRTGKNQSQHLSSMHNEVKVKHVDDNTASSLDANLIEVLEGYYGVGYFTRPKNMHEWTPIPSVTVFALIRATLTLLVHCECTDPQLPSICQRLRRLSHFLVAVSNSGSPSSAESTSDRLSSGQPSDRVKVSEDLSEADLWVLLITMHLQNKLKEIRLIAFSMCDNSDLIDVTEDKMSPVDIIECLEPFQIPFVGKECTRTAKNTSDSTAEMLPKRSGKFSHRAFLHAPWEAYTAEESAAIAAARVATSGEGNAWKSGKIALPGARSGVCHEVRIHFIFFYFNSE